MARKMTKYQEANNVRVETRGPSGRFRGGKLAPVIAYQIKGSETGVIDADIAVELDPIAGRLRTKIGLDVKAVYVPVPAMMREKMPNNENADNIEIIRQRLADGEAIFDLENEGPVTKRCGVNPISINGDKKVGEQVRFGYIAAVNHLRLRKYKKADLLGSGADYITPALISQNILDRFNAVLLPEDRVDGAVPLTMPKVTLPVEGFGVEETAATDFGAVSVRESDIGASGVQTYPKHLRGDHVKMEVVQWADGKYRTKVNAILDEQQIGQMSLRDLFRSEKMDALTREMREMVDKNPTYGEEIVKYFARGLSMETSKEPFVMYSKEGTLDEFLRVPTDAANMHKVQTVTAANISLTLPVPKSEFGGMVYIFLSVKPDEKLASQPHPIMTEPWTQSNFVADEMELDPVPVYGRNLYSDIDQADEDTRFCYVGHNHLQKAYEDYGYTRLTDTTTVDYKSAIWQLEVPLSVTDTNILYPSDLDHYPFADQTAEVVSYTVNSRAYISTPTLFGPTPVEELAEIEDADIFEDAE